MLQEHDALPDVQHSLVVLEHTAPQKDEKLPGSQHYRVVLEFTAPQEDGALPEAQQARVVVVPDAENLGELGEGTIWVIPPLRNRIICKWALVPMSAAK